MNNRVIIPLVETNRFIHHEKELALFIDDLNKCINYINDIHLKTTNYHQARINELKLNKGDLHTAEVALAHMHLKYASNNRYGFAAVLHQNYQEKMQAHLARYVKVKGYSHNICHQKITALNAIFRDFAPIQQFAYLFANELAEIAQVIEKMIAAVDQQITLVKLRANERLLSELLKTYIKYRDAISVCMSKHLKVYEDQVENNFLMISSSTPKAAPGYTTTTSMLANSFQWVDKKNLAADKVHNDILLGFKYRLSEIFDNIEGFKVDLAPHNIDTTLLEQCPRLRFNPTHYESVHAYFKHFTQAYSVDLEEYRGAPSSELLSLSNFLDSAILIQHALEPVVGELTASTFAESALMIPEQTVDSLLENAVVPLSNAQEDAVEAYIKEALGHVEKTIVVNFRNQVAALQDLNTQQSLNQICDQAFIATYGQQLIAARAETLSMAPHYKLTYIEFAKHLMQKWRGPNNFTGEVVESAIVCLGQMALAIDRLPYDVITSQYQADEIVKKILTKACLLYTVQGYTFAAARATAISEVLTNITLEERAQSRGAQAIENIHHKFNKQFPKSAMLKAMNARIAEAIATVDGQEIVDATAKDICAHLEDRMTVIQLLDRELTKLDKEITSLEKSLNQKHTRALNQKLLITSYREVIMGMTDINTAVLKEVVNDLIINLNALSINGDTGVSNNFFVSETNDNLKTLLRGLLNNKTAFKVPAELLAKPQKEQSSFWSFLY